MEGAKEDGKKEEGNGGGEREGERMREGEPLFLACLLNQGRQETIADIRDVDV